LRKRVIACFTNLDITFIQGDHQGRSTKFEVALG
jgi:hypothetical protein